MEALGEHQRRLGASKGLELDDHVNGYRTMKEMLFSRYLFIFVLLNVISVIWSAPNKVLKQSIGCQQRSTSGRDYIGKANTTVDGIRCQRWSKTQRVETFNTKPYNRSFTHVGDHNFCRNPIGGEATQSQVWCYTTDPKHEKQNCSVPFCPPLKALDFSLDNDKKPDENNSYTHASLIFKKETSLPRSQSALLSWWMPGQGL